MELSFPKCMCKEASPLCVAVLVMMRWKSGAPLIFYFLFGSLNSLARAQNDEMWWKSQGSTLRTANEHHSLSASIFLFCKVERMRRTSHFRLFILWVEWLGFVPPYLWFWSHFKRKNLEGTWNQTAVSSTWQYDLRAAVQRPAGQEDPVCGEWKSLIHRQ